MPDWISNNVPSIVSTVIAGIILGVLAIFWKGISRTVAQLWTKREPRTETGDSAEPLDLRFVEFHSSFGVKQRHDGQWDAQIQSQWNVTNVSRSGMPARLLRSRLAKPRLQDARPEFEEATGHIIIQRADDIRANETERISIHFFAVLPSSKLGKSITLDIVVIDQLSNEHALPPIKVKPQKAQPPSRGQT